MISEEPACEMAMSSWCVQRAGRGVVVVAGRDDAHVDIRHSHGLSWQIARSWRGGSKAPLAAVGMEEIGRY
jgi:hypothetical protein